MLLGKTGVQCQQRSTQSSRASSPSLPPWPPLSRVTIPAPARSFDAPPGARRGHRHRSVRPAPPPPLRHRRRRRRRRHLWRLVLPLWPFPWRLPRRRSLAYPLRGLPIRGTGVESPPHRRRPLDPVEGRGRSRPVRCQKQANRDGDDDGGGCGGGGGGGGYDDDDDAPLIFSLSVRLCFVCGQGRCSCGKSGGFPT